MWLAAYIFNIKYIKWFTSKEWSGQQSNLFPKALRTRQAGKQKSLVVVVFAFEMKFVTNSIWRQQSNTPNSSMWDLDAFPRRMISAFGGIVRRIKDHDKRQDNDLLDAQRSPPTHMQYLPQTWGPSEGAQCLRREESVIPAWLHHIRGGLMPLSLPPSHSP